ncbi:MAG: glycosyltransferase family 2 protein, partial [Chitinophagaceae bacterium]
TLALCIPAYNAARYLPILLKSAQTQRIEFDEILVYDDGSTDTTKEVAEQFGATVVQGKVNLGCSKGKNLLAKIAKSDWLHFHDADDDILPNFTEVAHKQITRSDAADIILLHYQWINFNSKSLLGEPDYKTFEMKADPIKFNITNKVVNFALIKKTPFLEIGGFDTDSEVLYNEDRAFYTRAALAGLKFDYEPALTCINYYYPGSMSDSSKGKCAKASLAVWQKVLAAVKGQYSEEIALQILNNATFAATVNEWKTVRKSLVIAKELSSLTKPQGSDLFLKLFKLNAFGAFYVRELALRYFSRRRRKPNEK